MVFVSGWLFSALGQVRDAADARRPLLQAFLFVIFGIYFTWFWAKGQTVAMKTWKIRVVDRAGRPVSQPRALLRYACSWLWFLPPLALMAPFKPRPGEAAATGADLGRRLGPGQPPASRSDSSGTTHWPAPGWWPRRPGSR